MLKKNKPNTGIKIQPRDKLKKYLGRQESQNREQEMQFCVLPLHWAAIYSLVICKDRVIGSEQRPAQ